MWWGGRSSPARFLVPVLLPLALPLAAWWTACDEPHRARRHARAAAGEPRASPPRWSWSITARSSTTRATATRCGCWRPNPSVNLTYALPSLFQAGPAAAWGVAAAWFVAATLGWADRCAASSGRGPRRRSLARHACSAPRRWSSAAGASLGWALLPARPMGCGQRPGRRRRARLSTLTRSAWRSSPARVGRASGLLAGIPIADASRRPPPRRRAALDGGGRAARSLPPRCRRPVSTSPGPSRSRWDGPIRR